MSTSPSRARLWAGRLALAALLFRALVPAGCMLAPIDGRLTWILCPGDSAAAGVPGPAGAQAHPHHHHDVAGVAGEGRHASHDAREHCPYAHAGVAPLLAAAQGEPQLLQFLLPARLAPPPGQPADAPPRHAAARGPPSMG